eukprot:scaffold5345_cov126-Amphora_coffeaeformis.AAC.1
MHRRRRIHFGVVIPAFLLGCATTTHRNRCVMALANISPTRQRSSSSSPSSSSRTRIQASSSSRRNTESVVSLQDPHPRESPAQVLRRLADVCQDEGID